MLFSLFSLSRTYEKHKKHYKQQFSTKIQNEHRKKYSSLIPNKQSVSTIHPEDVKINKKQKGGMNVPLKHRWLLKTSQRFNFIKIPSNNKIGPGSYKTISQKKHYSMSFSKRPRFNNTIKSNARMGPGKYELPKSHSISIKISKNITKTFMDQIIERQSKNKTPGPGAYEFRNDCVHLRKYQCSPSIHFNSKIDRFKEDVNTHLGPAMYKYQGDFEKAIRKINQNKKTIQLSSNYYGNKYAFGLSRSRNHLQKPYPGPGSYQNLNTIQLKIKRNVDKGYRGKFGYQQQRWDNKRENKQSLSPGPGYYMKSKNPIQLSLFSPPRPSPAFIRSSKDDYGSISPRSYYQRPYNSKNSLQKIKTRELSKVDEISHQLKCETFGGQEVEY